MDPRAASTAATRPDSFITLDNGVRVLLVDTHDCCAYTSLDEFLLHPERVDHVITGVATTEGYTRWHIYADAGDVMELGVGWSCGNPFYYGYGFDIRVVPLEGEVVEDQPALPAAPRALPAGPDQPCVLHSQGVMHLIRDLTPLIYAEEELREEPAPDRLRGHPAIPVPPTVPERTAARFTGPTITPEETP